VAFGEITIALLAVPSGRGVIDSLLHRPPPKQTTVRPVPLLIYPYHLPPIYTVYTRSIYFPLLHQSSFLYLPKYINIYRCVCMCARVRECVKYICTKGEYIRNKIRTVTTAVENPKQIQKAIPELTDSPGRHG